MSFLICLGALVFLMVVAYRGFSVILFAPVAALAAVLATDPAAVLPVFSGLFMDRMVGFVQLYLPVFLLGAIFGKVIELSGFARSIVTAVIGLFGKNQAVLAIIVVCGLLTYGGVSLFVVVFAVYPFAAELFRQSAIPKRLLPGTLAIGAFTFTMDSLPGTPQIQNIIPTTFFKTDIYAAPWLGVIGSIVIVAAATTYIDRQVRRARRDGEGYGLDHQNEPVVHSGQLVHPLLAISPLLLVGTANYVLSKHLFPALYPAKIEVLLTPGAKPLVQELAKMNAIWSVETALLLGILLVVACALAPIRQHFADGSRAAVGGALLASLNTASEYGFGAVIAALPGFLVIRDALKAIPNPLINEAVTVTTLSAITGSASGGLSIALAAMADSFIQAATANGIPMAVLHRVAAMASGGMDTLPHNGAVITLLAVTGLTHRQSYRDIFVVTCIKTVAVFVVIAVYYATGLV